MKSTFKKLVGISFLGVAKSLGLQLQEVLNALLVATAAAQSESGFYKAHVDVWQQLQAS